MTTLPQTTPMRLPRPAGGGQITIPSGPPAAALGMPAGGPQMTASDVWRVFRSNLWLIALMVVVAAVIGYFVNSYLAKHYPKYTAPALVRVQLPSEVFSNNADEGSVLPQTLEVEVKRQALGLRQPQLMLDVLTNSDRVRQTDWFKGFNNDIAEAKENLLQNFAVSPMLNSGLISVEMTDRHPKDARVIVEEVVKRYTEEQQKQAFNVWTASAANYDEQYRQYKSKYDKIAAQLTNANPSAGDAQSYELFAQAKNKEYELSRLTGTRMEADRDYQAAENEFNSMQRMVDSGGTPPEIEAELMKDETIRVYAYDLAKLESAIGQNANSNSPAVLSLRRQQQDLDRKLTDARESARNNYIEAKKFKIQSVMETADKARKSADDQIAKLSDELLKIQSTASKFKMLEQQQEELKHNMDDVSQQLEKIRNRKLPSNWSPVSMFSAPPTPDTPSFPKLGITMAVAIMAGLALSVGIAFLREITDTSVRSPRDIARVGQMNLLGMIPHEDDDPQAAGARIPLVIFDAPHSMAAEEFRKLRTRLQHTASLDSTRSILVSSANPGDGKTTIACNLAAGLALNGRRILLVDANFRRPEIHNLFEVANERGFSDALNDLGTFDTLVRDTPVQNLYVMPTGPKPVNATELLESQLLIDFIERALEDYDHVIFDSGPLLIVSETMALAPRVDGVITVVRARENSRGVLVRMRDGLRQVKAEHLGVVLNAVRSQGGGYYGRNIKTYYAYQNT
jgi:succinoglycan biosynthesis transport protein ExoP